MKQEATTKNKTFKLPRTSAHLLASRYSILHVVYLVQRDGPEGVGVGLIHVGLHLVVRNRRVGEAKVTLLHGDRARDPVVGLFHQNAVLELKGGQETKRRK